MKPALAYFLSVALSLSIIPLAGAQSQGMGGMEMKDMEMKGMEMKGMDSTKCMDMQGMDHEKCMEMMKKEKAGNKASKKGAQGTTHKGTGSVQKSDPAGGKVTIAHDPIKSMEWPAMTMGFTVKDKALFDKLAADKKIEFEFVQQGKDFVITKIK